ncbi:MAG: outer membrane beta-barrel family protein, partial [Muribaculaceae bacterium]|nr:outer membrane beta-barrel family protein [Muribaculaceae bacterium]
FLPVTTQDLQGMRTQDVKKVEYYLHTTDPRFQGAQYAINFIMQKYEWGGYTKVTADKWLGVNRSEGEVYSKMAYKSMIFDLYADEIYLTDRHGGVSSTETFRFDNLYDTGPQTITRTSATESSLCRINSNDFAFRALYNSDMTRISNRLSYSLTNVPHDDAVNSLLYSSGLFSSESATSLTSSHKRAFSYNGNFFFSFSPKLSLEADVDYKYGKNESKSLYSTGETLSITNNASENTHYFQTNPRLWWRLGDKLNFITFLATSQRWNFINYSGNTPSYQKYNLGAYLAGTHFDLDLDKWNIGGEFGWIWESNHISDSDMNNNFPQTNVYVTFSPTDRHQFEANWRYGKDVPDASQKSPNMLQQDELMWYQGTPTLADFSYQNASLAYTWFPNNKWQLSANAYIHILGNRCVTIYSPLHPRGQCCVDMSMTEIIAAVC